jgi:AcrR family transcriptional regulator
MVKQPSPPVKSPREHIVDGLLALACEESWDAITLPMIAAKAGVTLGELRELFPSKGSIFGSFVKMIDRQVLDGTAADMASEPTRDRLLDIMLRRFDALAPYKAAIRTIRKHAAGNPANLLAMNGLALNSWRYMLAAAEIDTEDGLGTVRIQGAAIVFARALDTWLDEDEDAGLTRTMATLDKELQRGEAILRRLDDLHRLTAPFRGFARALMDRRSCRSRRRSREEDDMAAEI